MNVLKNCTLLSVVSSARSVYRKARNLSKKSLAIREIAFPTESRQRSCIQTIVELIYHVHLHTLAAKRARCSWGWLYVASYFLAMITVNVTASFLRHFRDLQFANRSSRLVVLLRRTRKMIFFFFLFSRAPNFKLHRHQESAPRRCRPKSSTDNGGVGSNFESIFQFRGTIRSPKFD